MHSISVIFFVFGEDDGEITEMRMLAFMHICSRISIDAYVLWSLFYRLYSNDSIYFTKKLEKEEES